MNVVTASGQRLPIRFSRPASKKVYIKITRLSTSADYPGDAALKQALIDYIGDNTSGGLSIGVDVTYIKLPGILTALPGVEDFELQIGTNGTSYAKNNIVIGYREKAVIDSAAITISKGDG